MFSSTMTDSEAFLIARELAPMETSVPQSYFQAPGPGGTVVGTPTTTIKQPARVAATFRCGSKVPNQSTHGVILRRNGAVPGRAGVLMTS